MCIEIYIDYFGWNVVILWRGIMVKFYFMIYFFLKVNDIVFMRYVYVLIVNRSKIVLIKILFNDCINFVFL